MNYLPIEPIIGMGSILPIRKEGEMMKDLKLWKILLLTLVCSLIFSVVFVTVQRIDLYLNPPEVPVKSIEKIK